MIDEPSLAATPEHPADPVDPLDSSSTGDDRVDAATGALGELDALPVSDHVERYAEVHSQLQDILNEVGSPASPVDRGR